MATIELYSTASGKRYRVRYRKPDNSQTDKRGFTTKRDAELFLANLEVSKSRGEYIDTASAKATIDTLGTAWLNHQTHLKPSSLRPIEITWRIHVQPAWGSRALAGIRHSEVQAWVTALHNGTGPTADKPLSATTVLRAYGVLAGILDTAVKDKRASTNAARGVNLPRKTRKDHTYLTHEQVSDLAEHSGPYATFILVLAYTGLRWGEAVGLQVSDLDMLRRRINVNRTATEVGNRIEVGTPKTHKRRSVPFPATLTAMLAKQCEGKQRTDLVFTHATKGGYIIRGHSGVDSRGWFNKARVAAKLPPLTPHDLRHTAASLAVSSGANVKAVQRMLGHASATMTLDTYADLFDDDLDAVATGLDVALSKTNVGKMWANGIA